MDRILQGSRHTISITLYVEETPTDSSTTVTIEVLRADGSVLVPAGTEAAAGNAGDGVYEYTLTPAHTASLDELTARWSFTLEGSAQTRTTRHEVVGGFYVGLDEIRAQPDLADPGKFSAAELATARSEVEDEIERHCGVAFVRRYQRLVLDGDGSNRLLLHRWPRRLLSAEVDGVAVSSAELATWGLYPGGHAVRPAGYFPRGQRNVTAAYEHGWEAPPPLVRRAALVLLVARARTDPATSNIEAVTADGYSIHYAKGGSDTTGVPLVDRLLERYRQDDDVTSLVVR